MSAWPLEGLWKRLLDPLLFSNIWVAAGAAAMVHCSELLMGLPIGGYAAPFLFFATVFTYNFQRVFRSKGADIISHSARHLWLARNQRWLKLLVALTLPIVGWCAWQLELRALLFLVPFVLVSVFYSIKVLPGRRGFRDLPYVKVLLISITWVATTVLLPFWDATSTVVDRSILVHLAFERGLFILAITIPFDIRDMHRDHESKRTWAQVLGEEKARWLAVALMVLFTLLVEFNPTYTANERWPLLLSGLSGALLLTFARSDRHERYFTFMVEGTMVLQWVLLLLFQ